MDEPAESASSQFRSQWTNPGDVFSVLLIVGADVIQLALAALTGHTLTPIAFSFGWVAYGISAVVSAVGENRLVRCPPEIDMDVVNLASGYGRPNRSWLLARLVRTFDHWAAEEVRAAVRGVHILPTRDEEEGLLQGRKRPEMYAGLCVVVCKWVQNGGSEPGVPALDGVWWSGLLVSAVQLGIAAIPWGLYGNWGIFVATACGTLLAYASGSFPQWRQEKWHWRKQNKTVALVPISGSGVQVRPERANLLLRGRAGSGGGGGGGGSRRLAIVILGADHGFDLEALAGGATLDRLSTRIYTGILAALWLVLLVTCTGIKTDTWYLLAVGGLGMLQNLAVAGLPRSPEALGIPIELVPDSGVFAEHKVMWALMELEMKYPGTGRQLVGMFFPGKLMGWETEWWEAATTAERRLELLGEAKNKEWKRLMDKQG